MKLKPELTKKISAHRAWTRITMLVAAIPTATGVIDLADTLNEIERSLDEYNRRSGSRWPITFGEVVDLHKLPDWHQPTILGDGIEPYYSSEFLGHTVGLLTISERSGRFVVSHAARCPGCGQWHHDRRDTIAYDAAQTCCLPW